MNSWSSKLLTYLSIKYPTSEKNIENTKEITLDYQIIGEIKPEIKNYLDNFKNIEYLNMCFCKLFSLENFPNLPNLIRIELNDNNLNEKEIIKLNKYPKLSEIYAANNCITSFDDFKKLYNMRDLYLLDFSDNPICKNKDYREIMFKIFPKLLFLDGIGKNNENYEEFEEENEEDEESEQENEEDKKFILDDGDTISEGENYDFEEEEEENDDEENINEEEEEEEREGEGEEEIENPFPIKKKKFK